MSELTELLYLSRNHKEFTGTDEPLLYQTFRSLILDALIQLYPD